MKDILDYTSSEYSINRDLECILEKKEVEKQLTDFERFLYGFAYQNIISSKMVSSNVVPVMSLSIVFLAITVCVNRKKSLLNITLKSLMALDPIIGIAVSDIRDGNPPFYSIKKPALKIGAYLLTGIVTGPMYIAHKLIPSDKINKLFETIDKPKNWVINKILSLISGQNIDYCKIYDEVSQEISLLEDMRRKSKLRVLKQKELVLSDERKTKIEVDKSLEANKQKQPLDRLNTSCINLSQTQSKVLSTLDNASGCLI